MVAGYVSTLYFEEDSCKIFSIKLHEDREITVLSFQFLIFLTKFLVTAFTT